MIEMLQSSLLGVLVWKLYFLRERNGKPNILELSGIT